MKEKEGERNLGNNIPLTEGNGHHAPVTSWLLALFSDDWGEGRGEQPQSKAKEERKGTRKKKTKRTHNTHGSLVF